MKIEELREKSISELEDILLESRREHLGLRIKHQSAELKNTAELSKKRKIIARVKTVIREKADG